LNRVGWEGSVTVELVNVTCKVRISLIIYLAFFVSSQGSIAMAFIIRFLIFGFRDMACCRGRLAQAAVGIFEQCVQALILSKLTAYCAFHRTMSYCQTARNSQSSV
jgi:hypothetical protein